MTDSQNGHDHDDHSHADCRHGHDGHDHERGQDHDHHGHDHGHGGHHHDLREASRRSLLGALVLTSSFMVVEVIGGIVSGSLALLADAGHMLTDSSSILLALVAIWIAKRPASVDRTFGYNRAEILAAGANALSLWVIAAWIVYESVKRVLEPENIHGSTVLLVGGIGLLVNIGAAFILHRSSSHGHSLNVEGALQHVLADLLGSVAVLISGVVIVVFEGRVDNIYIVDPILSTIIALLIVYSSWSLVTSVFSVLIEATPAHIDIYKLCSDIEEVPGVTVIHDVHAWTVTSGYIAFSAHVLADPDYEGDYDQMLREIRCIAREDYGLSHITIQLETSVKGCTEDHHVDHLLERIKKSQKRKLFAFGQV